MSVVPIVMLNKAYFGLFSALPLLSLVYEYIFIYTNILSLYILL